MKKAVVIVVLICFLIACFAMVGCGNDKTKTIKKAPVKKAPVKKKVSGMTLKKGTKKAKGLKKGK